MAAQNAGTADRPCPLCHAEGLKDIARHIREDCEFSINYRRSVGLPDEGFDYGGGESDV